jgi:serine/threonine protein kinase
MLNRVVQRTLHPSPSSSNNNAQFRQTLKRFRHPNIIVLYGYNFKGSAGEQFLVFEYAANGSLDAFLKDESKRADLPATIRLSIMYQVARAVHFLHTGAAGFKVFHRDIKSANICLTEDFTPRLIDCGLAKFVEDEHNAFPSETIEITGLTGGPLLGTIGYVCPEYSSKKTRGIKCDYIPACDVYSFGIVMAELIFGHLNGHPTNASQKYILNEETPIVDGWKQLKDDADKKVTWNAEALEVVCLTAIGCITPSSKERLSTIDLLDLLKHAITINARVINVEKTSECEGPSPQSRFRIDNLTSLLNEIRLQAGKGNSATKGANLGSCIPCNRRAVLNCGEGHALCVDCIEDAIMNTGASYDVRCLIDGCSSQPFAYKELCKHIHVNVWTYHLNKNNEQGFNEVKELQKKTKQGVDEINDRQKEMASVIDKCLPGWALQSANAERLKRCPTVVVITPSAVGGPIDLKTWFKNVKEQKYQLVFYCERSGKPGHEPFEISVDRKWMHQKVEFVKYVIICLLFCEK